MAVAARRRAQQEQSIVGAFWAARIRAEAEAGEAKSLGDYLDELLSDDERLDKSAAALGAYFDAQIEAGEATEQ